MVQIVSRCKGQLKGGGVAILNHQPCGRAWPRREGFDKKASTALLSQGVCAQTAATVDALRALYPAGPQPTGPAMADLLVAPALEAELVNISTICQRWAFFLPCKLPSNFEGDVHIL